MLGYSQRTHFEPVAGVLLDHVFAHVNAWYDARHGDSEDAVVVTHGVPAG